MKLNLACADFTFPLLEHGKSLDLISMLEMDGVDIGLFEGRSHLWPSREFASLSASAKKLKSELEARSLKAADVFLQMDPDFEVYAINHPEAERRSKARDWFERALEYAALLGCGHVTILPGVAFEGESAEDSWARSQEELSWRVAQAKAAGITLGVEAHIGSLAETPEKAAQLVADTEGLTLTLDYTHFTRVGIPDERVEPLVALASHFHARGARKGRLQANFSENVIDYDRVFKAMEKSGYSGWLGIEYVWIDWEQCNCSDNVSETIQFRDFFRERFA